jgi:transcription termination factor Rho
MSVLDRNALEGSPLADLHTIASELSVDGYRRLRRADLIDAIVAKQDGEPQPDSSATDAVAEPEAAEPARASGRSRSTSGRTRKPRAAKEPEPDSADAEDEAKPEAVSEEPKAESADADGDDDSEASGSRRRRGRRSGRGRGGAREDENGGAASAASDADDKSEAEAEADEAVEGVVELLPNGSGFVRLDPPEPSDADVYISSAQVKRCELVSGDRIAGPKRAPRRSERFASLVRIETINGRPASELADSVRFDDLPAAFPTDVFELGSDDPTLKAIASLTPLGKGSRVTITGAARSGKTETLRRLAASLAGNDQLAVHLVLSGVRPEEITEYSDGPVTPAAAVSFAASEEARNGAIEPVIDQVRRLAGRGADAVVLIDTLDGCSPAVARRALAAARNIVDGGSVTVIATASAPIGGETTVIALDAALAGLGQFPALDGVASGTLRLDKLVGEDEVAKITRARAEASQVPLEG